MHQRTRNEVLVKILDNCIADGLIREMILDQLSKEGYEVVKISSNDEDIQEIVKVWNAAKIIVHKKVDKKMQSMIRSALKEYSIDEIKESIENYKTVLESPIYFFSYKWRLEEFLQRGIRSFLPETNPLQRYIKSGTRESGSVTPPALSVSPTLINDFKKTKREYKNGKK